MVKREDEKWIARLTYQYPKLEKLSSIIPASSRKSCHEINLRIHDEECKGSLTFGRAFASTVAFGSFAQRNIAKRFTDAVPFYINRSYMFRIVETPSVKSSLIPGAETTL